MYAGIKSNNKQKIYKKICKELTNNDLERLSDYIFEHTLSEKLIGLFQKDGSALSRTRLTVILDDSVFKQIISNRLVDLDAETKAFYGRFFSGQVHRAVSGFQVVTLGVNVGEDFYPLYFGIVRKTDEELAALIQIYEQNKNDLKTKYEKRVLLLAQIKAKKAVAHTILEKKTVKDGRNDLKKLNIEIKDLKKILKIKPSTQKQPNKQLVAQNLVCKMGKFLKSIAKKGVSVPKLAFSCDSGYSNIALMNCCNQNGMYYISVPFKRHLVLFEGKKMNFNDLIEQEFLGAEEAHNTAQSHLPTEQQTPFSQRFRLHYFVLGQNVTFLIFRYQNSKKISIIYTPEKHLHKDTLRRRWFARTQIEQFFKMLKHFMHIHHAITLTKHDFACKIFRFSLIALHLQLLIRTLRQRRIIPKNAGIGTLRAMLAATNSLHELLKSTH